MALAAFDPERHHVGLGPAAGDDLFGFLIEGAYNQTLQNDQVGTEFGGGTDRIGNPTLSRWNQEDFTGGGLQETWGGDDAAWSYSLNVLPSLFDRSVRTCPPLVPWASFNTGGASPLLLFAAKGFLYAVFGGVGSVPIRRWDIETKEAFDAVGAPDAFDSCVAAIYHPGIGDSGDGAIVTLNDLGATRAVTVYSIPGLEVISVYPVPAAITGDLRGLALSPISTPEKKADILFSARSILCQLKLPDHVGLTGGSTVDNDWTKLGRLTGTWRAATTYNGSLYVLTGEADGLTSICQWDGTSARLVAELPYNFEGEAIRQFGGRLYVAGVGRDVSGSARYGELYELTGTSLRLVRSFSNQWRSQGAWKPQAIYDLSAHEGLLFFGDTGRCLVAYDVVNDAFFGGPALAVRDGVRQFRKLAGARNSLFAWITHPTDPAQDGLYRVAQASSEIAAPYESTVVTSDFSAEPGRMKRWSQVRVLSRGAPVFVDYSTDGGKPGGDTFEAAEAREVKVDGDTYITTASLVNVEPSQQLRLRIRIARDRAVDTFAELIGFTVSFAFLDTGKWAWGFTVNATERVERPGSGFTTEHVDYVAVGQELRRYATDRVPLRFRDVDGDEYQVQLLRCQRNLPVIGEGDAAGKHESFYTLTLLQV